MTLVYMVCDSAAIDPTTGACSAVQYVQAPLLIPPLDMVAGSAIAVSILVLWGTAAVWKALSK